MGTIRPLFDTDVSMRASRDQAAESSGRGSSRSAAAALAPGIPGAVLTTIVLLAGALLTWLAWDGTRKAEEQRAQSELTLGAAEVQSVIQDRLFGSEGMLRAGAGVANGFWPPSAAQWRRFVSELRPISAYPGIQGIGFIARLRTAQDAAAWSQVLRANSGGSVLYWPARADGQNPESAVVLFEPLNDRTRHALGYDMMSESVRRLAMEQASDTGTAALSGKILLVYGGGAGQPGFLLYLPVYATLTAPEALEERRAQLRGFVFSPFRAADFFKNIMDATSTEGVLEVYDGETDRPDALLYSSAPLPTPPHLTDVRKLTIDGHTWTIKLSSSQAILDQSGRRALTLIVGAGVAVTLLLAAIVSTLSLSRQRLRERVEAEMALAQREQQAAQVLEVALEEKHRQEAEIRQLNESLEQRVAERTAQLEVANRELSAANRDLEAFSYSVSHDLRAPLRAIDGHMQLVEQLGDLDEAQRHHGDAVHRNIRRMNQLIEDLLKLAFVGRRPLEKERVELADLVRSIINELQPPKPVVYEVDAQALGEVCADPVLLRQALSNLIENAVKFSSTADPPRITIGSQPGENRLVYFVRDNGVGFDMRYADKLFGVFERLHSGSDFEGTGVGLAIVKQVIERHGGRVWVEAAVGRGATFFFTL
jgi:signal transduction histidine kinase